MVDGERVDRGIFCDIGFRLIFILALVLVFFMIKINTL